LELDLSDPRHRARLPAELRSRLPNQGFVNYPEAQAVVQAVAELVNDGAGKLASNGDLGRTQPAVAVLALYPAQAELIRLLMHQDPNLATLDHAVDVGVPYAFRHREAPVVLLSLTRSHTHRAVAFGDGPHVLALAMTRARSKLIIFGDPGTLVRRSQWQGSLEHLDEDAAARERQLITRLVHSLPGCGFHHQPVYSHT
jgi:superfamily I DNA and/or RNA helicase